MTRFQMHEQMYYLRLLKKNHHRVGGLYAVYENPSLAKRRAYAAIARECADLDGCGLCVLTYNCSYFTAGYFYPDPATGELRARIELPKRTLDFAVVE